eukprot:gene16246-17864_t
MAASTHQATLLGVIAVVAGGGTFWMDGHMSVTEAVLSIAFGLAALALMAAVSRMRANLTEARSTITVLKQQLATDNRVVQLQTELTAARRDALELDTKLERHETASDIDALIKLYAKKLMATRQQIQIETQRLNQVRFTAKYLSDLKQKVVEGSAVGGGDRAGHGGSSGGGGEEPDLNTTLDGTTDQLDESLHNYIGATNDAENLNISGIFAKKSDSEKAKKVDEAAAELSGQGAVLAALEQLCEPLADLKELGYEGKKLAWTSTITPSKDTGGGTVFEAVKVEGR